MGGVVGGYRSGPGHDAENFTIDDQVSGIVLSVGLDFENRTGFAVVELRGLRFGAARELCS